MKLVNHILFVLVLGGLCVAKNLKQPTSTPTEPPQPTGPPKMNKTASSKSLASNEECGVQYTSDRIVGGEDTAIDEFPWTALLFYQTDKGVKYKCGGTLIKRQTVVTAAHCFEGGLKETFEFVRLGEWNTNSVVDCTEDECTSECLDVDNCPEDCDCAQSPKDIKAKEIIIHPSRTASKNDDDIALIILEMIPPYTDFIRPICLPVSSFEDPKGSAQALIVAGWGSTTQYIPILSNVKQKLKVNAVPFDECKEVFLDLGVLLDANKMICAGGKRKKGTCAGDSGGPLMFANKAKFYLTGVISFGTKPCAEEGIPGVFVNVWNYNDWINTYAL